MEKVTRGIYRNNAEKEAASTLLSDELYIFPRDWRIIEKETNVAEVRGSID